MKNNINSVMTQQKMTQGDLAEMVGVRREYINRIIKCKITPSVTLGMRIANALGVVMEDLFIIQK